jgi:uncharacterized protein YecT (DUF1311 family)
MQRRVRPLGWLLMGLPCAFAQTPSANNIDGALKQCLSNPDATTLSMLECYGTAYQKMDQRLNEAYKALMAKLPADQKELLKGAQKKWLQFREAELKLSAALDPNAGGSLARVNASSNLYEVTKHRVEELESYLSDASSN